MEPIDIDKIFRNKLLESNDLHKQEMESAKPFVWSAVLNKIEKSRSLTWYHLAAAVVLLMISFSFVLYNIQKGYNNEINLLSNKIDQFQKNHLSQLEFLQTKDIEVESLEIELKNVELKLSNLMQQKTLPQRETYVYRTDTVYLKQLEYVTISTPIESEESNGDTLVNMTDRTAVAKVQEMDDIIFPSYSSRGNRPQPETIKLKFGPLSASRK